MKRLHLQQILFFYCILLFQSQLSAHGFDAATVVSAGDDHIPIGTIVTKHFIGIKSYIDSVKEKHVTKRCVAEKEIRAVAFCKAPCYYELTCTNDDHETEVVHCSAIQQFYRVKDRQWIPAHQLEQDDLLCCKNGKTTRVVATSLQEECIDLKIIEVKKYHTYFVTKQDIFTHNFFIPVEATLSLAVPFEMVLSGGSIAIAFGPVTIGCTVAALGVAAVALYTHSREKHSHFEMTVTTPGNYDIKPTGFADTILPENSVFITNPDSSAPTKPYTFDPDRIDNKPTGFDVTDDDPVIFLDKSKSIEDIIKEEIVSEGDKTNGRTTNYVKPGTYEDALKDFESLHPVDVKSISGKKGFYGSLEDGREVNVRESSTYDKSPTLEVTKRNESGNIVKKIKCRYEKPN